MLERKKIVSIHQPSYFSWFGLLDKIIKSDIFVILDNVQFNKRAFQHRTLYSNNSGKPSYLTLPVNAKNHQLNNLKINEVTFKDSIDQILEKHYNILRQRYGKFKGFKRLESRLKMIFEKKYTRLIDLVMETMNLMLEEFEIKTKVLFASDLSVIGKKSELMLNITKEAGGDIYLSGVGAKVYMNEELFEKNNIEVIYQDFKHIQYDQKIGKEFQEGCMALEIVFLYDTDYKDLIRKHYLKINQIEEIRGLEWIK